MNIECGQLPNGLTIITDRMDTVETVSVGVWVNVGTRDEHPDLNGISHLLEHMAFKGTKRRDAYAIAAEIEDVGGQINAYTSREHTAYFAKVLKDDVPIALDILGDILQHSELNEDEIKREKAVILQEINQANDTPDDIVFDHFQEAAFPDQAMGRPVLGRPNVVLEMDREHIRSYMDNHYCGDQMIVAGAGNLDHEAFSRIVESTFDSLPKTTPHQREPGIYVGSDVRAIRELEQAHVVFGTNGISYKDDEFYSASVLTTILGGGMSSRLFQEIREKRGLAYSIYSFLSCYNDCGLFGIYAGTGPDEAHGLLSLVLDEVDKIQDELTDQELDRARAQLKSSILMSLESTSARCERLARHMMIFGRTIPTKEILDKVEAVNRHSVLKVTQQLFSGTPTIAALGPIEGLCDYDELSSRLAR